MDPEVSKIISLLENSPGARMTSREALLLIDNGKAELISEYIDRFIELNSEVAEKLIKNTIYAFVVNQYVNRFVKLKLDSEAAIKMIESGGAGALFVVENLDIFVGFELNAKAAIKMIESGQAWVVVNYIDEFVGLNAEVVVKLLKYIDQKEVISLISKNRARFDIEGILKDKDKNLSFNSYYIYEIVKHPSLISDICS